MVVSEAEKVVEYVAGPKSPSGCVHLNKFALAWGTVHTIGRKSISYELNWYNVRFDHQIIIIVILLIAVKAKRTI